MTIRPEILLHPQIPKPLHGIAPRVIKGQAWWDVVRREAYASTDYHCAACGVPKHEALFHHWLEAHELYSYDWEKGWLEMEQIVPLCHACHNYIHKGRMIHMLGRGEMNRAKFNIIIAHGDRILDQVDPVVKVASLPPPMIAKWENWRMVVDGVEYGPSTPNYEAWERGEWRNWKP